MPPTICAHLIVRNEAARIHRCLASLAPHIDEWCIVDTGSTDGTPELIEAFFAKRRIAGTLHRLPFESFAKTRNAALDIARECATSDYLLLCDADMELVGEPGSLCALTAECYRLRQEELAPLAEGDCQTHGEKASPRSYWNARLLRRDSAARYDGRPSIHEVLSASAHAVNHHGAYYIDHADGGARGDNLARELAGLTADHLADPEHARTVFYLADTHRYLGNHAEASRLYQRRATMGGFDEEAWYARYQAAMMQLQLGNLASFVAGCLVAYQHRPTRAEPLYHLAAFYRSTGQHEAALLIAEQAERIPYPASDLLFVEPAAYSWGMRQHIAVSGCYSESPTRKERGAAANAELAVSPTAPTAVRRAAVFSGQFYARALSDLIPGAVTREIVTRSGYPQRLNPSLCWHEGRLLVNVRTVNYRIGEDGRYIYPPGDHGPKTVNVLTQMYPSGAIDNLAERELEDRAGGERFPSHVEGYEDMRIFSWRERLWGLATVGDRAPVWRCQIVLCEINVARGAVTRTTILQPDSPQHEKNWIPVVADDGCLRIVYSADPTRIIFLDQPPEPRIKAMQTPPLVSTPPMCLQDLRGGSPPVCRGGEWLYIAHEVAEHGPPRKYLHRFVRMDRTLRITSVSRAFYFEEPGIEFCAGLVGGKNGEMIATFGVGDARAYSIRFDGEQAFSLAVEGRRAG